MNNMINLYPLNTLYAKLYPPNGDRILTMTSTHALGCWPDGLELSPGFYPGSYEQHRQF